MRQTVWLIGSHKINFYPIISTSSYQPFQYYRQYPCSIFHTRTGCNLGRVFRRRSSILRDRLGPFVPPSWPRHNNRHIAEHIFQERRQTDSCFLWSGNTIFCPATGIERVHCLAGPCRPENKLWAGAIMLIAPHFYKCIHCYKLILRFNRRTIEPA